jgi:hypothetical protein
MRAIGAMRAAWPCLLLAAALAGCARPADTFTPSCPNWAEGLSHETHTQTFGNGTAPVDMRREVLATGLLRDEGRPLDRVVLDFGRAESSTAPPGIRVQDARLTVAFHRDDDGRPLSAYDRSKGPPGPANPGSTSWVFQAGNVTRLVLGVDLLLPGETGAPTAVTVDWRYDNDLDGDPHTPSGAVATYTASFWYRTC